MQRKDDGNKSQNPTQAYYSTPDGKKNQLQSDHSTLNLSDLSPFIPVFNSHLTPSYFRYSSSNIELIQTPARNNLKCAYIDQIDQRMKSIAEVISWANDDEDNCSFGREEQIDEDESSNNDIQRRGFQGFYSKFNPSSCNIEQQKTIEAVQKIPQSKTTNKKGQNTVASDPTQKDPSNIKRSCNCKKTQCLKLYCDCFRENQTCVGCSCVGCHNTQEFQLERSNAMAGLIDRNPQAFRPKIQSASHTKGCNCKKSGCQKKYCECYQAGLKCGDNCKCQQCKNCDPNLHQKTKSYRSAIPSGYRLKMSMSGPSLIQPSVATLKVKKQE